MQGGKPRILTLDVETSPNLASVWGLWNQNVSLSQLRETTQIICWAAKWHGEKKIHSATDHHNGHQQSIKDLYDLVCSADIIVGYNSRNFDMKHIRREFLLAGFPPPPPWKDVDLLTEVRRNFKFTSNKLQHILEQLGLTEKIDSGGQALWNACVIENDPRAWKKMRTYCRNDVRITEQLYDRLLPWLKHPHVGLYTGNLGNCPKCDSGKLQRRGFAYTNASKFQQWACMDCGTWTRSKTSEATSKTRETN